MGTGPSDSDVAVGIRALVHVTAVIWHQSTVLSGVNGVSKGIELEQPEVLQTGTKGDGVSGHHVHAILVYDNTMSLILIRSAMGLGPEGIAIGVRPDQVEIRSTCADRLGPPHND